MSFRLFIYYCALCGGGVAFLGWIPGEIIEKNLPNNTLLGQGLKGMCLGMSVAFALSLVDALWNAGIRRIFSVIIRVMVAVPIGAMTALLGALICEAIHLQFKEYPVVQKTILLMSWTLLGLLIGASLGVFDLLVVVFSGKDASGAIRKILNGVLGGTLGGILGGVLYLMLDAFWTNVFQSRMGGVVAKGDLWSPSATGFVALGACIGLLIGLAQVILKEAWLKVERGFRSGRELILTKPEITIGRAESCDIGLFGDPTVSKLHARINRQGNDYIVTDENSESGTFVNDRPVYAPTPLQAGDAIRVGRCVLRFGERQKSK